MRLPSLFSKIIHGLRKNGFDEAPHRGKGSHRAFVKVDSSGRGGGLASAGGRTRLVIVPHGKDIPRGTLLAILDQAGLSREEFLKLI